MRTRLVRLRNTYAVNAVICAALTGLIYYKITPESVAADALLAYSLLFTLACCIGVICAIEAFHMHQLLRKRP